LYQQVCCTPERSTIILYSTSILYSG
jgi:hypothetical protein